MIGDRWGVTTDEVTRAYPCDQWVQAPTLAAWRGISVHAPVEHVWAWLTQVRLAPYSYDWIDNLGHQSPRILRDLPEPAVGDPFTRAAGIRLGRILSLDPCHQLTARVAGTVISYVLDQPHGVPHTRLLMKIVSRLPRPLAPMLAVGDLVMARRQLLNWKQLAEATSPLRQYR